MAKFFIIALTVMLVMQGYVSWHVWRVLSFSTPVKVVIILLMLVALACMVMQFQSDTMSLRVATAIYEIGNSWLIIMFYLLLIFLVLDIGRAIPQPFIFNNDYPHVPPKKEVWRLHVNNWHGV